MNRNTKGIKVNKTMIDNSNKKISLKKEVTHARNKVILFGATTIGLAGAVTYTFPKEEYSTPLVMVLIFLSFMSAYKLGDCINEFKEVKAKQKKLNK